MVEEPSIQAQAPAPAIDAATLEQLQAESRAREQLVVDQYSRQLQAEQERYRDVAVELQACQRELNQVKAGWEHAQQRAETEGEVRRNQDGMLDQLREEVGGERMAWW
jgi:hypothetical protein